MHLLHICRGLLKLVVFIFCSSSIKKSDLNLSSSHQPIAALTNSCLEWWITGHISVLVPCVDTGQKSLLHNGQNLMLCSFVVILHNEGASIALKNLALVKTLPLVLQLTSLHYSLDRTQQMTVQTASEQCAQWSRREEAASQHWDQNTVSARSPSKIVSSCKHCFGHIKHSCVQARHSHDEIKMSLDTL